MENHLDLLVEKFKENGWCRTTGVCSAEECDAMRKYSYESLQNSLDLIENEYENPTLHFGAIAPPAGAVKHRWNLLIPMGNPVIACTKSLIKSMSTFVDKLVTQEGILADLSVLISHPGSVNQRLHYDTACSPTQADACLVTFFIALQDITLEMGPTVFVGKTNNAEKHKEWDALDTDELREVYLNEHKPETHFCVMKKGDCCIMDSRLLHYGSENNDEKRVLFCVSLKHPAHKPKGSTHCIRAEYKGKFTVEKLLNLEMED